MPFPAFSNWGSPAEPVALDFIHVDRVMQRRSDHAGIAAPHLHPHLAQISIWFKGAGRYRVEDQEFAFSAPMLVYVPANVLHGFEVDPASSDCLTISLSNAIVTELSRSLTWDLSLSHYLLAEHLDQRDVSAILSLFELAMAEYAEDRPVKARLLALYSQSILEVFGRALRPETKLLPDGNTRLALAFKALVDRHYNEEKSVDEYCRHLGVTRYQLGRACEAVWSMGIKAYIDATRLRVAKRLLYYTPRSIAEVGYETGFSDPAYFSRFFQKMAGISPAAWRKLSAERSEFLLDGKF